MDVDVHAKLIDCNLIRVHVFSNGEMNVIFRCRTQILEREDPKERERYFIKFIKIMKVLLPVVCRQSSLLISQLYYHMHLD